MYAIKIEQLKQKNSIFQKSHNFRFRGTLEGHSRDIWETTVRALTLTLRSGVTPSSTPNSCMNEYNYTSINQYTM